MNKKLKNLLLGLTLMVSLVGCGTDGTDTAELEQLGINTEETVVSDVEADLEESVEEEHVTEEEVESVEEETATEDTTASETTANTALDNNREIEVDGGNTSGYREANVKVNIGHGNREYWAYTNEHGQLVKVTAKQIVVQDDATEDVNSDGRYYSRMADVPGVGADTGYDRGHVIADSLGGVANAYNITPQEATLNRHGDQAYMEKVIRDAGGATDFVAIITYPNTETQVPSHYEYTYTVKGNRVTDSFANGSPDELNKAMGLTGSNTESSKPEVKETPAVESGDGVWVDENGNGLIKGSSSGIYHTPESSYYDRTTNPKQMFKSVQEAKDAGYRAPKR